MGLAGWFLVAIFGALFAFFFVVGVWRLTQHVMLVTDGESASGEVVDLKPVYWRPGHGTDSQMRSNRPEIHPVVEFTDQTGTVRRIVTEAGSYPTAFAIKDKVEVVYPVGRPEKATLFWWVELWLEPVIFIIVGMLPMLLLLRRRPTARARP